MSSLEAMEGRLLLSGASGIPFYQPSDLPPRTVEHQSASVSANHPLSTSLRQLSFLDNEGKILTGKDRQGDEWVITVHGPGSVIVTDATPGDAIFDDELDSIQLIGTDINKTYVTGQVTASARMITDGVVFFNHLYATEGVASIILNGFSLARTVPQPSSLPEGTTTEVYLPGGVRELQFHNIEAVTDLADAPIDPFDIVIGDPSNPLGVEPTIRLDSIFNTVFNGDIRVQPLVPSTRPTVNIVVNGQMRGLEIVSSTAAPIDAANQVLLPTVGTTGRTAVQAVGIDHLRVIGSARNLTAARQDIPFRNGFSGLDHLGSAQFGGNADAVGLDVAGPIGRLSFARGLGNPAGVLPRSLLGLPMYDRGYPSAGLLGGLVTGSQIGSIEAGTANTVLQTANDPDFTQLYRQGYLAYYPRLGNAFTNAAIVSSNSIGATTIVGNSYASEIRAGSHYPSFVAGLEPVRAPSSIGPVHYRGDLVNSPISSTVRPIDFAFGDGGNQAGPGRIRGHFQGVLLDANTLTPLNDSGAGFYARNKGWLPPPQRPTRVHGVLVNA